MHVLFDTHTIMSKIFHFLKEDQLTNHESPNIILLIQNKMRSWYIINVIQLLIGNGTCNKRDDTRSKNQLPYFRRQVDKDLDNLDTRAINSDDPRGHLVSILINNVKEIFDDNDEMTEFSVLKLPSRTTEILRTKNNVNTIEDPKLTDDVMGYRNVSITTLKELKPYESISSGYEIKKAKHSHMLLLSENSLRKSEQKLASNDTFLLVSSLAPETNSSPDLVESTRGRSCIFCNNVLTEDCVDPKNKLISSVICEREDDECYSQHTPFGIIDRGCFNAKRNATVYVCACNLCNYISISEMPYVFSSKQEWVHNVVQLSRSRNLRKSILKDMACLRCEVNTSNTRGIAKNENCLDGNIGSVPTEICDANEVCAVKVIKAEGYVWRGCVRGPLYNYWWNICDRDLCNYDSLVSIYDYL